MDTQNNIQPGNLQPIPEEVRLYLENLLKEANITPPDDLLKNQIIDEMYVDLDNFLSTVIIENMPPTHMEEFIRMNEENKPKQEIEQFLKQNLPNSDEVFAKAFIDFRDIYLGKVGMQGSEQMPNQTN